MKRLHAAVCVNGNNFVYRTRGVRGKCLTVARGAPCQFGLAARLRANIWLLVMRSALPNATIPRFALVGALLAGIVLALLMAVSGELHELVHRDGGAPEHQCLATLMQTGGCDGTLPQALIVAAFLASLFGTVPVGDSTLVESVFACGSVFEHAPPFIS
jgi:hypothetical protein